MKILIVIFVILSFADAALTLYEVKFIGVTELNPILNFCLQKFGMIGFLTVKICLTVFVAVSLWILREFWDAKIVMIATVVVYGLLLCYHLFIIRLSL